MVAKPEGPRVIKPVGELKLWTYVVRCDGTEIRGARTTSWGPANKLPDLSLGFDWDLSHREGNWHWQSDCFVGRGETEKEFTRKVFLRCQTEAAIADGFSLDSVGKKSGLGFRQAVPILGAKTFEFTKGASHWLEKWRDAYGEGQGNWGVNVYRVHGEDIIMLAYIAKETDDPAILDQWVERFLQANLPTPR